MRNLGGCLVKLENDYKWSKVDEFGLIRGVWIIYVVIEEERVIVSYGYCIWFKNKWLNKDLIIKNFS